MNAPANIRVNAYVPFPSLVTGTGPVTITKVNGIWTVGFSFSGIGQQVPQPSAYATDLLLGYDIIAKSYFTISLATLAAAGVAVPVFDTLAGTYNVTGETILLINKAVPAAHNIQLPTAASRVGVPIVIKDYAGNAASNVATILPNGSELIDGLASLPINSNYGGFKLVPISTGGWYIDP